MRGTITLERKTKSGILLEKRTLPMRSFNKGFIDSLYVLFAQIAFGAPYVGQRAIQGIGTSMYAQNRYWTTNNLAVGSPPGGAFLLSGDQVESSFSQLPGECFGILVGANNTAVTPTDYTLVRPFGHGTRGPDGAAVLIDSYAAGEDNNDTLNGNTWKCQPFVVRHTFLATSASIKVWRAGACGNCTVSIRPIRRARDAFSLTVDTTDIVSGTILEASIGLVTPGALQSAVFGTPKTLYAGRAYALVARVANAVNCYWRKDDGTTLYRNSALERYYAQGCFGSGDAGVTWDTVDNGKYKTEMFELYGQAIGEFQMGGTRVEDFTVAAPNVSFTIKRLFLNNSGGNLTVQEVGIASAIPDSTDIQNLQSYLIARDVVGPAVVVADTEILDVTYTIQTTV